MSMENFWKDCWKDEQEKVAMLTRHKALLMLNARMAELVLTNTPGCSYAASQIRITLETLEHEDLAHIQACNQEIERIRQDHSQSDARSALSATGTQAQTPVGTEEVK